MLELLPTHLTDAQMAEQLFVSRNTVKTHVKGLYRKLEVSSRADAVVRAREVGLLPRDSTRRCGGRGRRWRARRLTAGRGGSLT